MPSLSSHKKAELLEQFLEMTDRRMDRVTAQKMLKNANYRVDVALDTYLDSATVSTGALERMFDQIRVPSRDTDKNLIDAESTMEYLNTLGVTGENAELFVVLELVRAPGFGQMARQGYIDGWKEAKVAATPAAHRQHVRERVAQLRTDPVFFKQIYRYAFIAGKDADQKALPLDRALVFWDMFFDADTTGRAWRSSSGGGDGGGGGAEIDWLALWKRFLADNWTRSVNRDMWNQTLEFATKTVDDETLGFWTEDAAWPGVVDDFVKWYRAGAGVSRALPAGTMEVDED